MQGVDVQRVVASLIAEDKQDIEDAAIKPTSSTGSGEIEMNKRIMDLNIGENKLQIKETESADNCKSVIIQTIILNGIFVIIMIILFRNAKSV